MTILRMVSVLLLTALAIAVVVFQGQEQALKGQVTECWNLNPAGTECSQCQGAGGQFASEEDCLANVLTKCFIAGMPINMDMPDCIEVHLAPGQGGSCDEAQLQYNTYDECVEAYQTCYVLEAGACMKKVSHPKVNPAACANSYESLQECESGCDFFEAASCPPENFQLMTDETHPSYSCGQQVTCCFDAKVEVTPYCSDTDQCVSGVCRSLCMPDGMCDTQNGETHANCPIDCDASQVDPCPSDQTMVNGQCECKVAGAVINQSNACECPAGTVEENGACVAESLCSNGLDDDGDELIDEEDYGCYECPECAYHYFQTNGQMPYEAGENEGGYKYLPEKDSEEDPCDPSSTAMSPIRSWLAQLFPSLFVAQQQGGGKPCDPPEESDCGNGIREGAEECDGIGNCNRATCECNEGYKWYPDIDPNLKGGVCSKTNPADDAKVCKETATGYDSVDDCYAAGATWCNQCGTSMENADYSCCKNGYACAPYNGGLFRCKKTVACFTKVVSAAGEEDVDVGDYFCSSAAQCAAAYDSQGYYDPEGTGVRCVDNKCCGGACGDCPTGSTTSGGGGGPPLQPPPSGGGGDTGAQPPPGTTGGFGGGTTGGSGGTGDRSNSVSSQDSSSSSSSVNTADNYCEDGQQCMDSVTCREQGGTCFDPTFSCNEGDSVIGQSCCCIPGGKYLACENEQCVVKNGTGTDQCGKDVDCRSPEHTTCQNQQCVIVPGPGKDECDLLLGCNQQEHAACENNQCIIVSGPGDNECSSDIGCGMHSKCVNNACTLVAGVGSNECNTNVDCEQTHTECQNFACVEVAGIGADDCATNADCLPPTVSSSSSVFTAFSTSQQSSQVSMSMAVSSSSKRSVLASSSSSSVAISSQESSATSTIVAFSSEASERSSESSETSSSVVSLVSSSSSLPSSLPSSSSLSSSSSESSVFSVSSVDSDSSSNASSDRSSLQSRSSRPTLITQRNYICGNGRTEPGEECDDGNTRSGDDCDSSCYLEQLVRVITPTYNCGNGRTEPDEQCDDGNRRSGDGCTRNCVIELTTDEEVPIDVVITKDLQTYVASASVCGNGTLERNEECDDSNQRDNDGCSSQCQLEIGVCGDGIVQTLLGEQCEQATHNTTLPYGCKRCLFTSPLCGDGNIDPGEECDEGQQNSDAPDAVCRLNCSAARCGDGVLDSGEQCDDGDRLNNDGCDRYCVVEAGKQVVPNDTLVAGVQFVDRETPSSFGWPPVSYPQFPTSQNIPYQLPLAQLQPLIQGSQQGVAGETGPAAVAVVGAGSAAGFSWIRRRKK